MSNVPTLEEWIEQRENRILLQQNIESALWEWNVEDVPGLLRVLMIFSRQCIDDENELQR